MVSLALLSALFVTACSREGDESTTTSGSAINTPTDSLTREPAVLSTAEEFTVAINTVITAHGQTLTVRAESLTTSVKALDSAIHRFLSDPDTESLSATRTAWQLAHAQWLDFNDARFSYAAYVGEDQPFADFEEEIAFVRQWQFIIDASPIMEGFLDGIEGYPDSGLVMDQTLPLNDVTLRAQNGITSDEEICLGFHPLAYFLWERTPGDFSAGSDDISIQRRRQMLITLSALLTKDVDRFLQVALNLEQIAIQAFEPWEKQRLLFDLLERQIDQTGLIQRPDSPGFHPDPQFMEFSQPDQAARKNQLLQLINEPVMLSSLMHKLNPQATINFLERLSALPVSLPEDSASEDTAPDESGGEAVEGTEEPVNGVKALKNLVRFFQTAQSDD